jgi:uncharacterized protein YdaU (DUF1376 family)
MSWKARGLYRELLDECWVDGIIPDDIAKLADICDCTPEEMEALWPEIAPCWTRVEGGYTNARLESQRTAKDAERAARARAGRGGGLICNSRTRAAEANPASPAVSQANAVEPQANRYERQASDKELQPGAAKFEASDKELQASAAQFEACASESQASADEDQASAEPFEARADIAEQEQSISRARARAHHGQPSPAATVSTLTLREQAELVYQAYPHKVGKGAALRSIEKALSTVKNTGETDPAGYLLARIRAWIAKRERDQTAGSFIPEYPNPATWFNQQRYDDPDNAPRAAVTFEQVDPETFWGMKN